MPRSQAVRVLTNQLGLDNVMVCDEGLGDGRLTGNVDVRSSKDLVQFLGNLGISVNVVDGGLYIGCSGKDGSPPLSSGQVDLSGSQSASPGDAGGPTRRAAPGLVGRTTEAGGFLPGSDVVHQVPKQVRIFPGGAGLEKLLKPFGSVIPMGPDLLMSGASLDEAAEVGRQLLACPSSGEIRIAVVRLSEGATEGSLLQWFSSLNWLGGASAPSNALRLGSRLGVAGNVGRDTSSGSILLTARLFGSVYRPLTVADGEDVPIQNATLIQTTGATSQSVTYRTVGVNVTATPVSFAQDWRAAFKVSVSDLASGGLSSLLPVVSTASFEGDLHGPGPRVLYGRSRQTASSSRSFSLLGFTRTRTSQADTVAVIAEVVPDACR